MIWQMICVIIIVESLNTPKEKDGIETYEIDYIYDNNYFNPFYLFDDNYFIDNSYNKLRQQDINKYLDNNKKVTLINIII